MTSLFSSNLQEIRKACTDTSTETVDLVANFSGTAIYYASSGWGRIWRWFYDGAEWLFKIDLKRAEKAQQAISNTQLIYAETLPKIEEDAKAHHSYLFAKGQEKTTNEIDTGAIRRRLSSWNQNTRPFIDFLKDQKNEKKNQFFKDFFPKSEEQGTTPFVLSENEETIERAQKIIALEGYFQEPLPTILLAKLARKKRLNNEEEQSLAEWIKKANQLGKQIPVGRFHEALCTFVSMLKEKNTRFSPDLVNLEMGLSDRGLNIFHQIDQLHYQGHANLQAKDPIICNQKSWTIREQIGKKEEGFDHTRLFALEEASDRLALYGINSAIVGLKNRIGEEDHWGIPFVKILDMDQRGKCAFVEMLHGSLVNQTWKSTPEKLSKKEERTLSPVSNMIEWWIKKDYTPKNFSLKYLMFDQNERLTYSKLLFRDEFFSFPLVEDLIFQIANGNLAIFQFLIQSSGLYSHTTRSFYEIMVKKAAEGKEADSKKQASYFYIDDPKVVDQGKKLHEDVLKIKWSIVKQLKGAYAIPDYKALYQMINEATFACYEEIKSASILWPDIEKRIKKTVIRKGKLQPLPPENRKCVNDY